MANKNNAVLMLTDSLRAVQQIPDKAQRCDIYERFFAYQLGEECATESNPLIDALITMMVSSYERYKAKRDEDAKREAGRAGAERRWKSRKIAEDSTTIAEHSTPMATDSTPIADDSRVWQTIADDSRPMAEDSTPIAPHSRNANININSNINYNNPPIIPPKMGDARAHTREGELSALQSEVTTVQGVADCATSALQDNATPLQTTVQTPLQTTPQTPVRVTRKFTPPTVEEVAQYVREKGYTMSAEAFCDYYESVGWRVGRTGKKMEKWRSAVNNWERRDKELKPNKQTTNYANDNADTREARELARLNAAYVAISNGEL